LIDVLANDAEPVGEDVEKTSMFVGHEVDAGAAEAA
jgi:hypothetical protein